MIMDHTVEPLRDPESHSGVPYSDNMDESNIQERRSLVNGNHNELEHTSDLMTEFDNNSSPYACPTQGTADMIEQDLHGISMNEAASASQEVLSATERHHSEPVPVLGSPVSNQVLQNSPVHASSSIALPDFHVTHLADTQSTTYSGRGHENPTSLGTSLNGGGPFPTFLSNGVGNTGPGLQTNGRLALEEIHEAMDRGSGPGETAASAAHALVPHGYDFRAQGQQHGQVGASSQTNWYRHHQDQLWATHHDNGAPQVHFDRAFDVSRPLEEYQSQRLAFYGRAHDFGFEPANYENQEQQSQLGHEHNTLSQPSQQYHGQAFGFGTPSNMLQEEPHYPDPDLSHQPAYGGVHIQQPPTPDVQPGTVTRRRVRSNQRQLRPAGTPNRTLVVPNHFQTTPGMIPHRITGNDVMLRFGSLTEAENAMRHVANPVNQDADRTVPRTPEEERGYVRQLVAAMQSTDYARDNGTMISMWERQRQNTDAVENTAWRLLRRAMLAHSQSDPLVPGARIARYQSFDVRMRAIIIALAQEKTICKRVSSPSYQDQLIDDPAGAQIRVHNNRKVNGGKKIMIEEGKRRIAEAWDRESSSPLIEANLRRDQRQIAHGGSMEINDGGNMEINDGGNMEINDGGNMEINDGGNMEINDGDSMVVNVSERLVPSGWTSQTQNARGHTSDTPGASAQEQAKTPGSKRAAAKRAPATKARKRKNDDESDSPYQPSGKKNTKKQPAAKKQPATKNRVKTEKPYNGIYPVVHDPELNTGVISSVPSPPRSVPVPLHPPSSIGYQIPFQPTSYQNPFQSADYQNPYQSTGYQNPYQVTGSREAYLNSLYHNDYAPPPTNPMPVPEPEPVRESYEDRMRAAGYGIVERRPLPQQVSDNNASFGQGLESSARPSLFGGPHQVDNPPSSLFGGPHQVSNLRSRTVDPYLTGRNPLSPSQPLSELALSHGPNTVGNEFDENEPEPEELYQFASLGHRRRRSRRKPNEFDDLV